MTKAEKNAKIEELEREALRCTKLVEKWGRDVECVGHGQFVEHGEMKLVREFETDCEKYNAIMAQIREIETAYYEEHKEAIEQHRLKDKIRRYKKELAELEERKAYLEKWLAENE